MPRAGPWTAEENPPAAARHSGLARAEHYDIGMIPMARFAFLACSVLTWLLVSACSDPASAPARTDRPPFDLAATRQLISQQNQRFTEAHLKGDVATIDEMFASDAKVYPPGSAALTGPQALHDFTVDYIKAGLTEFREDSTDFYGTAEQVVDAGTYVVTYGPDHVTERGKYLNVWTQVNGRWKIQSNMWNSSP